MILAIKYIAKEIMRAFADILIDQLNEKSKREILDLSQRYKWERSKRENVNYNDEKQFLKNQFINIV